MQLAGMPTIESLRMAERQRRDAPAMHRLWHALSQEWQRMRDRAVARAVSRLDHPGVAEDYRAARGSR
jgi:hypothetical protein